MAVHPSPNPNPRPWTRFGEALAWTVLLPWGVAIAKFTKLADHAAPGKWPLETPEVCWARSKGAGRKRPRIFGSASEGIASKASRKHVFWFLF